ncbi:MAG: hypothetical protein ACOVRN_07445 [Flavobacterium sp.]
MYTSKYRPRDLKQYIGNKDIVTSLMRWVLEWDVASSPKCALLSGLSGIGKSLLVDLVATTFDFNAVYWDDDRDKETMNAFIRPLLGGRRSISKQLNLLIVSDIDSGCDHGFINMLLECIKETRIPMICICDNRYDQSLKPLVPHCIDLKLNKPTYTEVYALLYNIVTTEKLRIKEQELRELYEQSNGDIRFILNTMELGLCQGKKNIQSANIFETTGRLFSVDDDLDRKYETYWLSSDIHPLMVQENYISNVLGTATRLENTATASGALSDMDLFQTRVQTTASWECEPHTAISVLRATSNCCKRTMMKFPQYLGRVSAINKQKTTHMRYDAKLPNQLTHEKPPKSKAKSKANSDAKEKKPRGRPKKAKE